MNVKEPERVRSEKSESQAVLPGILTEKDIFRQMMRKIGARGGAKNTSAQQEHRRRTIKAVNERKKAKKDNQGGNG